ncbi:MAG: tripartite tricarboxylate transporter substrate binding protein [Pusillimonas sp.]
MQLKALFSAIAVTAGIIAAPAAAVGATDYPTRSVRLIVPTPPGNALDISARLLAQQLTEQWKQTVVVENRPGGSGIPAMLAAKSAAPDGYTLVMGPSSSVGINPGLFPDLPYKPLEDFDLIKGMYTSPLILVANKTFTLTKVPDLIEAAKKEPAKYSMAYGGPYGSTQHLSAQLFQHDTGTEFIGVPYQGSAPAMQDLIGGQTQLLFDSVASALPHIRSGAIKPVAVTTPARLDLLPDVPAVAETGYADFNAVSWGGVIAPKGLDPAIVQKIAADINTIVGSAAVQERLASLGLLPDLRSTDEWKQFVATEIDKWGGLIKAAGIKAE